MKICLLLGAGFSKNWGAPLIDEFWDHVLNDLIKIDDTKTREKIFQVKMEAENNFEQFYQIIMSGDNEYLKNIVDESIKRIYIEIEKVLKNQNEILNLTDFFKKFMHTKNEPRAIFTLNQDLLVDRYMLNHINANTDEISILGLDSNDLAKMKTSFDGLPPYTEILINNHKSYVLEINKINLIKLHGSFNWLDSNNKSLILIGADKIKAKCENNSVTTIFSTFNKVFKDFIADANKILIIGYSFNDEDINQTLLSNRELKMFICNPLDRTSLIDKQRCKNHKIAEENIYNYYPTSLDQIIEFDKPDNHSPFPFAKDLAEYFFEIKRSVP